MEEVITINEILKELEEQKISPKQAYKRIYKKKRIKKLKKGRFVKVIMNFKEHKVLTFIFGCFTLLPLPIGLVKYFLKKRMTEEEKNDLDNVTFYKGMGININAPDEVKIIMKVL